MIQAQKHDLEEKEAALRKQQKKQAFRAEDLDLESENPETANLTNKQHSGIQSKKNRKDSKRSSRNRRSSKRFTDSPDNSLRLRMRKNTSIDRFMKINEGTGFDPKKLKQGPSGELLRIEKPKKEEVLKKQKTADFLSYLPIPNAFSLNDLINK